VACLRIGSTRHVDNSPGSERNQLFDEGSVATLSRGVQHHGGEGPREDRGKTRKNLRRVTSEEVGCFDAVGFSVELRLRGANVQELTDSSSDSSSRSSSTVVAVSREYLRRVIRKKIGRFDAVGFRAQLCLNRSNIHELTRSSSTSSDSIRSSSTSNSVVTFRRMSGTHPPPGSRPFGCRWLLR